MLKYVGLFTVLVALVAGAGLVLGPMPAQEVGLSAAAVAPESGNWLFSGGRALKIYARTQTTPQVIGESPNWTTLNGATVSWTVASGDSDLLHVTFSGECSLSGVLGDDFVKIRVLDNGAPMEPYDGSQAFCVFPATYTGSWVGRASPGSHTITVQFLITDNVPGGNLNVSIDDWILKLVVYD